jgi:hypothetical protein
MTEERIERTFQTGDSAEIEIGNVSGTIEIQGWNRPEVQIVAVKQGDNGDTTVEIGGEGTRVWARTRSARGVRGLFGWLRHGEEVVRVDYAVRVPHTSSVAVSGVSGPINIAEIARAVKVHSVDGQITLRDLTGDVSAQTVNSAVEGRRIDGTLAVETVSGGVDLSDSRLSSLRAESVDGSIRATGQIDNLLAEAINGTVDLATDLNPHGEYAVKTVNGSFHLAVPPDTACEVVASGVNIDVVCGLPHAVEEKRWGRWAGHVNDGGGADVRFNTVNGVLRITEEEAPAVGAREPSAEPVPAMATLAPEVEAPAPATAVDEAAAPALSKMDILKMVEQGELAVEDALERLRNLN